MSDENSKEVLGNYSYMHHCEQLRTQIGLQRYIMATITENFIFYYNTKSRCLRIINAMAIHMFLWSRNHVK